MTTGNEQVSAQGVVPAEQRAEARPYAERPQAATPTPSPQPQPEPVAQPPEVPQPQAAPTAQATAPFLQTAAYASQAAYPAQQPSQAPTGAAPVPPQQPTPPTRQQPVNGFTVAGLVLAILATIVALWAFGDKVSVFGVVGLALGIIGWFYTKDYAAAHGQTPSIFNRAIVVVVIVLSVAAIAITPFASSYTAQQYSRGGSYYGGFY